MMKNVKSIDAYIKLYPKDVQVLLKKMRRAVKSVAPKATEAIKYGLPTLVLNGNLIHFGAFKSHIGFYPSSSGVAAFKKQLRTYKCSKGAIQFPFGKPIPFALVKRITKYRVKQNIL